MKGIIIFLFLFPFTGVGHPGIAIVKDSKGNIFYSDLQQVWKIADGKKSIVVPRVHTHELFIDSADNLYGEHLEYVGEGTNKFTHYLWVLSPQGMLDTAFAVSQAYINDDYSLARDKRGYQYFLKLRDSTHIFKQNAAGETSVFATGSFRGIKWLHPQEDGSLLYELQNNIYRISNSGQVILLAKNIADAKPSFCFSRNNPTNWGMWEDKYKNVYVAVFSDQAIKKIAADGTVTIFYKSKGKWTPTHGVFDDTNGLWVLECSDKNEIRVVRVEIQLAPIKKNINYFLLISGILLSCLLLIWFLKKRL